MAGGIRVLEPRETKILEKLPRQLNEVIVEEYEISRCDVHPSHFVILSELDINEELISNLCQRVWSSFEKIVLHQPFVIFYAPIFERLLGRTVNNKIEHVLKSIKESMSRDLERFLNRFYRHLIPELEIHLVAMALASKYYLNDDVYARYGNVFEVLLDEVILGRLYGKIHEEIFKDAFPIIEKISLLYMMEVRNHLLRNKAAFDAGKLVEEIKDYLSSIDNKNPLLLYAIGLLLDLAHAIREEKYLSMAYDLFKRFNLRKFYDSLTASKIQLQEQLQFYGYEIDEESGHFTWPRFSFLELTLMGLSFNYLKKTSILISKHYFVSTISDYIGIPKQLIKLWMTLRYYFLTVSSIIVRWMMEIVALLAGPFLIENPLRTILKNSFSISLLKKTRILYACL